MTRAAYFCGMESTFNNRNEDTQILHVVHNDLRPVTNFLIRALRKGNVTHGIRVVGRPLQKTKYRVTREQQLADMREAYGS
jgi:hypothetical protein